MSEEEFFNLHRERLQNFVDEQKTELSTNSPQEIQDFIKRSSYLSQLIIDKSNSLISKIFEEFNLNFEETRNVKGTIICILQYLLLGVSVNLKECLSDFNSYSEELLKSLYS